MVADVEELEILAASEIHARRPQCQRGAHAEKLESFQNPDRRWNSQVVLTRTSEGPPQMRSTLHVEKSTTMFFEAESDGSQPSDTLTDDGEARNDFLDDRREITFIVNTLNQELLCAKNRIIPNTTQVH